MDNFDKLERLHNLLKKGIITEEDFLIQKEKLLNDNLDVKEIIPEETKILPINPSENSNYIPKTTVIPTIQETAINQPENSNNSLEKEEEEIEEKSFFQKNKKIIFGVLILFALVALGNIIYKLIPSKETPIVESEIIEGDEDNSTPAAVEEVPSVVEENPIIQDQVTNNQDEEAEIVAPNVEEVPDSSQEDVEINIIRNFVQAEDNRDFETMKAYFSPNLKKYWDIKNPTFDKIEKSISANWNATSDSKNYIESISKIDDNKYELMTNYEFTSKKTGELKSVTSKIHYVFDDNGQIIKIYGVKD